MKPDRPGYWWWRMDPGQAWEAVKVKENRDGELTAQWIGETQFAFVSIISGEWGGAIHPPNW